MSNVHPQLIERHHSFRRLVPGCIVVDINTKRTTSMMFEPELPVSKMSFTRLLKHHKGKKIVLERSIEPTPISQTQGIGNRTYDLEKIVLLCAEAADVDINNIVFVLGNYKDKTCVCKYVHYNDTLRWYLSSNPIARNNLAKGTQNKFMCLNGTVRPHRVSVMIELIRRKLTNNYISFNTLRTSPKQIIKSYRSLLTDEQRNFVEQNIVMSVDNVFLNTNTRFTDQNTIPTNLWDESLFSVITETTYYGDFLFPTEKTWKVFDNGHPFVVISNKHYLKFLKRLGFKIAKEFDSDYDNLGDDVRLSAALDCAEELLNSNISYDKELHIYNKQLLKTLQSQWELNLKNAIHYT